jgi:hypothetical protein
MLQRGPATSASAEDLRPDVLFAADRVLRVVLEALAHIEDGEPWPPFSRGHDVELSETVTLAVGARDAAGEEVWQRLRRAPGLATKLHFGLWAAYYEGGGSPTTQAWTPLTSLVGRMGDAKHIHGGYLDRDLRLVVQTLDPVFAVAAAGKWRAPARRCEDMLRSRLWQEGMVSTTVTTPPEAGGRVLQLTVALELVRTQVAYNFGDGQTGDATGPDALGSPGTTSFVTHTYHDVSVHGEQPSPYPIINSSDQVPVDGTQDLRATAWAIWRDESGPHQISLGQPSLPIPVAGSLLRVGQSEGVPYCPSSQSCA